MRLHHLEVTAFGPFADTIRVDFDALCDAGLFLLSGPTGAGKSSVLDAVCFALYGDVPGDRSTAKRLRCDLAEEGVAPRVVLEATLSGRRFRLDRSPAWQRPKKRGEGITTEQARVSLSECVPGAGTTEWQPLSTRLDEAGHLVTRLVGMNLPQFCQVALLPQGRFQAFLRAGSDERHALLQQVFQTGRFDQVEGWLRNRRVDLRRESQAHHDRTAGLLSRISEVSEVDIPDDWSTAPGRLTDWSSDLASTTAAQSAAAVEALRAASDAEESARLEVEAGNLLDAALRLLREAHERAEALDAEADARAAVSVRLEATRRAASVRPLHDADVAAAEDAATTRLALEESLGDLGRAVGEPVEDASQVESIRHRTIQRLAEVDRLQPLAARARELTTERARVDEQLTGLTERASTLEALLEELPGRLDSLREQAQALTWSAARVPDLRTQVTTLHARRLAARLVTELEQEVVDATAERGAVVTELQSAKEAWLSVRERRLEGMAAEIAASLVVGGSCPVCGSADHPAPAAAEHGAPDVEAERSARRVVDDLEVVLEARTQHVRDLESRLATARGAAGEEPDAIPGLVEQAEATLHDAEADLARQPLLLEEVSRAEARLTRLDQERDQVVAAATAAAAALDRLSHEHDTSIAQIDSVLAETSCADLEELASTLRAIDESAAAADTAHTRHQAALARCEKTKTHVTRAAAEAGFDSPEDAVAAWLTLEEAARLEAWAAQHDRARERVQETLADAALQAAAAAEHPDLPGLEAAHADARQQLESARRIHDGLARRSIRLAGLAQELEPALQDWAPVRHDHETAASLSSFVEGKSPDNRLQMRLSAYVLAHRLSQVVAAANLRLHDMSDQRYSLIHTGERGAGEKRGGLSLLVRDDWSGESRDPATLSGGETFVVSLALALGLADVITAEAGGADLETLFVDEGFGSLDAETLDDVMDTLDSLREGGRVVGVVSHVAEMQVRIPTQLRVNKARHGSRVTQ